MRVTHEDGTTSNVHPCPNCGSEDTMQRMMMTGNVIRSCGDCGCDWIAPIETVGSP